MAKEVPIPVPGERNVLITSALPYVNNVPHLGNIIGCVLSADVYARYCRLRGYNTLFICGTDEYGTATETKAIQKNCTPREICDKYHKIHKQVYDWFDIKFDYFGRTSTSKQTEVCQDIFLKLMENDYLQPETEDQPYCDTCKRFLADRMVEGTCPTPACNYDSARGDQCDKCGQILKAINLGEPKCKVCQSTPRKLPATHLHLKLPQFKEKLKDYTERMSKIGCWSKNAIKLTDGLLKVGLETRPITRDLKWGVPVPHENFKDKVFYVWFDAPIGYISITACYTPEWEKWWKNPDNVELYQFMGKDNVTFHTVMFPSTLIGTGENWTLINSISVTEYLNYEEGKFSKSRGIGVFGDAVKYTTIPVEVWRYYLLVTRPEESDSVFKWEDLQAKLNGDLVNNFGNFVYRVLSFIAKPSGKGYGCVIPDAPPQAEPHSLTEALTNKVGDCLDKYTKAMEKVKLKQGLKIAIEISIAGNKYLQDCQFWKLYKEDQGACAIVLRTSARLVYLLACVLEPFMPSFSLEVLKQLNVPQLHLSLSEENGDLAKLKKFCDILPRGHKIGKPEPLFKKLENEEMESYRHKFAGSQATAENDVEPKGAKISDKSEKKQAKESVVTTNSSTSEAEITISTPDIPVEGTKVEKLPGADF